MAHKHPQICITILTLSLLYCSIVTNSPISSLSLFFLHDPALIMCIMAKRLSSHCPTRQSHSSFSRLNIVFIHVCQSESVLLFTSQFFLQLLCIINNFCSVDNKHCLTSYSSGHVQERNQMTSAVAMASPLLFDYFPIQTCQVNRPKFNCFK